jgi:hypothetical protein
MQKFELRLENVLGDPNLKGDNKKSKGAFFHLLCPDWNRGSLGQLAHKPTRLYLLY